MHTITYSFIDIARYSEAILKVKHEIRYFFFFLNFHIFTGEENTTHTKITVNSFISFSQIWQINALYNYDEKQDANNQQSGRGQTNFPIYGVKGANLLLYMHLKLSTRRSDKVHI